jgi:hypothetical protein
MLELLLLGLATYRATRILTRDAIFTPVRDRVFDRFPPMTSKFGYLFTCEWCMSIWVGSLFVLWSILAPTLFIPLSLILSASAVAGLLTAYEDK